MPNSVAISIGHFADEPRRDIEYPANVKLAGLIHSKLLLEGYTCNLIGGGQLQNKVSQVNSYRPEIAIECHFNWLEFPHNPQKYGDGYEVLCWPRSIGGKLLGTKVLEGFKERLPFRRRGTGLQERSDLYFLKHTVCPALIIEPLWLDNPQEITFLSHKHGYEFIAEAVVLGIQRYFVELQER